MHSDLSKRLKPLELRRFATLTVNRTLTGQTAERVKKIANANLTSKKGLEMRSKQPVEVESAFENINGNFGVRRFLLRWLEKVKIEWGLYSIGHNMRKIAALQG